MTTFIHETSIVDPGASVGEGTKIWHFSHVYPQAVIGGNCSLGQNVMVADHVQIGDNVKIQNNVSLYSGVIIADDVFLGPSCVFTNISNPRSQVVRRDLYEQTVVGRGATIGANATIVCGITIGRYAFVSAGAVVTRDVPDYELISGVPARHVGWMSRHGHPLKFDQQQQAVCPESGLRYELQAVSSKSSDVPKSRSTTPQASVHCLDLREDDPLPAALAIGKRAYREFKEGRNA
jgi:UDP-2-acetamido-3-amino-2,3-dideoxy-glucuronate N-acetyltransferase